MPGGAGVVVLALGAGWMLVRRRLAAREHARVLDAAAAALEGARREVDGSGREAVVCVARGVRVSVHAGAPIGGDPDWMTGLGVVARYVTGAGPEFRAGSAEPEAHLRTAGPTMPLAGLYGRSIPIVGEHREAKRLVGRALESIEPTGALLAPFLRSDGHVVSAWIARIPTDGDLPEIVQRLSALAAELARWRSDVLDAYAAEIGATIEIDTGAPSGDAPALRARLELGGRVAAIVVDARYERTGTRLVGPGTFAVRARGPSLLAIPRERMPLDRLRPELRRRIPPAAQRSAPRALLRGEPGWAVVEWALPPSPSELAGGVSVLRALAPVRKEGGPFR